MAAVGHLTLEFYLPMNGSLKGKRSIVKPLRAMLRKNYNVSVCESDAQDVLSRAVFEVVCVSQTGGMAQSHLQQIANRLEVYRPDAQLIDYYIELIW